MERIRTLVCDNLPAVRMAVKDVVETRRQHKIVGEAETGNELVQKAGKLNPAVVITDFDPEYEKGFLMIRQLNAVARSTYLLIFSGWTEELLAERCIRLGADGYVRKQEPLSKFVEALNCVGEGGTYTSERVKRQILERLRARGEANVGCNLDQLNNRELEVLSLFARGKDTKEIAQSLNLRLKTVETYRLNVMRRLGVGEVAELAVWSMRSVAPMLS